MRGARCVGGLIRLVGRYSSYLAARSITYWLNGISRNICSAATFLLPPFFFLNVLSWRRLWRNSDVVEMAVVEIGIGDERLVVREDMGEKREKLRRPPHVSGQCQSAGVVSG